MSIIVSVSLVRLAAPGVRQPMIMLSISWPITVVSFSAVSGDIAGKEGGVTSLPFSHWPKYFAMMAIVFSGSRSPAMQIATLLGR